MPAKYSALEAEFGGGGGGVEHGAGDGEANAVGVGGALGVDDFGAGKGGADGVDGHLRIFRDGVVVAFESGEGGGVGADDGDGVVLGGSKSGGSEREDAVVLE